MKNSQNILLTLASVGAAILASCSSEAENLPNTYEEYLESLSASSGTDNKSKSSSSSNLKGSSSSESQEQGQLEGDGTFTDPRDDKKYKYEVAPNGTVWMSENLNYSRENTLGYCYGVDIDGDNPHKDAAGCDDGYGRVYTWETAMDGNAPQGLCPVGWHVPSVDEWVSIMNSTSVSTGKTIVYGYINMSSSFRIYAGNYNPDPTYPLGWQNRGIAGETGAGGFFWVSDRGDYFTGLWDGGLNIEVQNGATYPGLLFSVRCVSDAGTQPSKPSSSSSPMPQSSSSAAVSSSSWSGEIYYCDYGITTSCGGGCHEQTSESQCDSRYGKLVKSCDPADRRTDLTYCYWPSDNTCYPNVDFSEESRCLSEGGHVYDNSCPSSIIIRNDCN